MQYVTRSTESELVKTDLSELMLSALDALESATRDLNNYILLTNANVNIDLYDTLRGVTRKLEFFSKVFTSEFFKKISHKDMLEVQELASRFFDTAAKIELPVATKRLFNKVRKQLNKKLSKCAFYLSGESYASNLSEDRIELIRKMVYAILAPLYNAYPDEKRHYYIQLTPDYRWDLSQTPLDKLVNWITLFLANYAVLNSSNKDGYVWCDYEWLCKFFSKSFLLKKITDNNGNVQDLQVFQDNKGIIRNKNNILTALKLLNIVDSIDRYQSDRRPRSFKLTDIWRAKLHLIYNDQVKANKADKELGKEIPRAIKVYEFIKESDNTAVTADISFLPEIKDDIEVSDLSIKEVNEEAAINYYVTHGYILNPEVYNRTLPLYRTDKLNTSILSNISDFSQMKMGAENFSNASKEDQLSILDNLNSDSKIVSFFNDSAVASNQVINTDSYKYIISRTGRVFQSGGGFQNLKSKFKKLVVENTKIQDYKILNIDISDCHAKIVLNMLNKVKSVLEKEIDDRENQNTWFIGSERKFRFSYLKRKSKQYLFSVKNIESELEILNESISSIESYLEIGKQTYADNLGISKDNLKKAVYAAVCGSDSILNSEGLKTAKKADTEIDKIMKEHIDSGEYFEGGFYDEVVMKLFKAFKVFRRYVSDYTCNIISPKLGYDYDIYKSLKYLYPESKYSSIFTACEDKYLKGRKNSWERKRAKKFTEGLFKDLIITNGLISYPKIEYMNLSPAQKAAFILQGIETNMIFGLTSKITEEGSIVLSNEHDGLVIAVPYYADEESLKEECSNFLNAKLSEIIDSKSNKLNNLSGTMKKANKLKISIKDFQNKDNDSELLSEAQEWLTLSQVTESEDYIDIPDPDTEDFKEAYYFDRPELRWDKHLRREQPSILVVAMRKCDSLSLEEFIKIRDSINSEEYKRVL